MFTQSIRFGRILGIPLGVNYTWFIVFILITLSLSTQYLHLHPDWSYAEHLIFGIITSILFFGSVVLHELGHSVIALKYGIPVKAITLFIFGGVANIAKEPEKPMHEFNIAIAGPIVSALLGALFYGLKYIAGDTYEGVSSLGDWLGRINLMLALFNLIPGFPLDGGRVFRAIVWKYTGSYKRATTIAASSGQFFAYVFIFFGVWQALTGNFFDGLWIGFIGWFLLSAAQSATLQLAFRYTLKGVTAAEIMTKDCLLVPGNITVADLIERHVFRTGARCSIVMDGERFRGLVTLHELKKVPKDAWAVTLLQSVMVATENLLSVTAQTPADKVLQLMNDQDVSQVPVLEDGRLLGVIGRDRLLNLVQAHLELKA